MKIVLIIVFAASSALLYAQENAKIYFIRDTGFSGSMSDFKEFIDGKMVCKLDNKSYSIHEVSEGEHSVTYQANGKELNKHGEKTMITMKFESGKTYYFQMMFIKKFATVDFTLNELTENAAKKLMTKLKEDTNCFK